MANLFAVAAALQSVPAAKSAKMPSNDGPGPQITHHESGYPLPEEVSLACYPTPLRVDPQAYEARCVATKGPCFSIVGASLQGTDISPWLEPLDMTYEMLLSDESAQGKKVIPFQVGRYFDPDKLLVIRLQILPCVTHRMLSRLAG